MYIINDIIYMINFIVFVSYIVSINDNNFIIKILFLVLLFILKYYYIERFILLFPF